MALFTKSLLPVPSGMYLFVLLSEYRSRDFVHSMCEKRTLICHLPILPQRCRAWSGRRKFMSAWVRPNSILTATRSPVMSQQWMCLRLYRWQKHSRPSVLGTHEMKESCWLFRLVALKSQSEFAPHQSTRRTWGKSIIHVVPMMNATYQPIQLREWRQQGMVFAEAVIRISLAIRDAGAFNDFIATCLGVASIPSTRLKKKI